MVVSFDGRKMHCHSQTCTLVPLVGISIVVEVASNGTGGAPGSPLRGAAAPRRPSSFLWGLVLQPLLGVVTPNPRPAARASITSIQRN